MFIKIIDQQKKSENSMISKTEDFHIALKSKLEKSKYPDKN